MTLKKFLFILDVLLTYLQQGAIGARRMVEHANLRYGRVTPGEVWIHETRIIFSRPDTIEQHAPAFTVVENKAAS